MAAPPLLINNAIDWPPFYCDVKVVTGRDRTVARRSCNRRLCGAAIPLGASVAPKGRRLQLWINREGCTDRVKSSIAHLFGFCALRTAGNRARATGESPGLEIPGGVY